MATPPPSVGAARLRRLAEKADGLRGQPLILIKRADGDLDLVAKGGEVLHPGSTVLCDVQTDDKHPQASRPDFSLALTRPSGKVEPIRPKYDAIFWSESAVEKFVLPYYHRVRDPEGVLVLAQAYRDHQEVYALAHVQPTDPDILKRDDDGMRVLPQVPGLVDQLDFTLEEWQAYLANRAPQ